MVVVSGAVPTSSIHIYYIPLFVTLRIFTGVAVKCVIEACLNLLLGSM